MFFALMVSPVVIAAALVLFPVHAANGSKAVAGCLSKMKQFGTSSAAYLSDHDGRYLEFALDRPSSVFVVLRPYGFTRKLGTCPGDDDREAEACGLAYPDDPLVTS